MPNRIIKESTFESDKIACLTDFQFRLWVGLITQADDKGHGDARPAILKGHLFSLRERVTIKDIDTALHTLAATGCVSLYQVGERPYYEFPNWTEHQYVKNIKPKYPLPEEGQYISEILPTAETRRNSEKVSADFSSNTIQYNPNTNPNTNTKRARAKEFASDFEEAWSMYPRKEGDKEAAKRSYIKAREEGVEKETILSGLNNAIAYYKTVEPQFIPMGATWFNQRRWNDVHVEKKLTTLDIAKNVDISDF